MGGSALSIGASVVGGLLGKKGSKSNASQTSSSAPWEPAQPMLKGILADTDMQRQRNMDTPFNDLENKSMGAMLNTAKGGLFSLAPSMSNVAQQMANGAGSYNPMSNFDASGNFNFGGTSTPQFKIGNPFEWTQNDVWRGTANGQSQWDGVPANQMAYGKPLSLNTLDSQGNGLSPFGNDANGSPILRYGFDDPGLNSRLGISSGYSGTDGKSKDSSQTSLDSLNAQIEELKQRLANGGNSTTGTYL